MFAFSFPCDPYCYLLTLRVEHAVEHTHLADGVNSNRPSQAAVDRVLAGADGPLVTTARCCLRVAPGERRFDSRDLYLGCH